MSASGPSGPLVFFCFLFFTVLNWENQPLMNGRKSPVIKVLMLYFLPGSKTEKTRSKETEGAKGRRREETGRP